MKKFLATCLIIIFGVFLLPLGVYAAEGDEDDGGDDTSAGYIGELDPFTGEPVNSGKNGGVATGAVKVTNGVTYNYSTHMFNYSSQGGMFSCSAADGMILTDPVNIALDGEFNIKMYKNGKAMDSMPDMVSDPGTYVVMVWDDNSETQLCSFQIVSKMTGSVSQYILPDGFVTDKLYIEGEETRTGRGSVDFTEEGYYQLTYRCSATQIEYNLDITVDHTPPQVVFEGLEENGTTARGPVKLTGLANDDTVYITYNDKAIRLDYDNELKESGNYHVIVVDSAGNSIDKSFKILVYLNVKSIVFILLFIAIIIGLVVALYISRKRLRVR